MTTGDNAGTSTCPLANQAGGIPLGEVSRATLRAFALLRQTFKNVVGGGRCPGVSAWHFF